MARLVCVCVCVVLCVVVCASTSMPAVALRSATYGTQTMWIETAVVHPPVPVKRDDVTLL